MEDDVCMLLNENDGRHIAVASRLEEYCRLEGLNELFLLSEAARRRRGKGKKRISVRQALGCLVEWLFG